MNCFIASAFDHEDIDALYERGIRPVLSELDLKPLRVDRIEHNDDIDNKIFELIDKAQLCIADLTYARPSVYYEAGYAFGQGKPVIYVARSDHFTPRMDDTAGNLRVHFDLQMKNIIKWEKPNGIFKNQLRRRIKHVIAHSIKNKISKNKNAKFEGIFKALSQNQQLLQITNKAKSLLQVRGFSRRGYRKYAKGPRRFYVLLQKSIGKRNIHVHILAMPRLNQTELKVLPYILYPDVTEKESSKIQRIESIYVFATLYSIKPSNLAPLFPDWTPESNRIFRKKVLIYHDEIQHFATAAVIDGVKSPQGFTERLREIIGELL